MPVGWLEEIILFRAYARAKETFDNAKSQADVPDTEMVHLVEEITMELVKAAKREHQRG